MKKSLNVLWLNVNFCKDAYLHHPIEENRKNMFLAYNEYLQMGGTRKLKIF